MLVRSLRMLAVLIATVVLAAACGGSSEVEELKLQLEDVLRSELPSVQIKDVNCGEPNLEPDSQFLCTAGVDGGRLRVQAEIDADGFPHFERVNALVDVDRLELEIAADLLVDVGFEIVVDCGDGFRVEELGAKFLCTATASGQAAGVEITVDDIDGNTDWFFPVPAP